MDVQERPEVLSGDTIKVRTGCGNAYVTINKGPDGKPFEVFMAVGKAGGCSSSQCEAMGRLVSAMLRSGISVEVVIDQLNGLSCQSMVGNKVSCPTAMAQALRRSVDENQPG